MRAMPAEFRRAHWDPWSWFMGGHVQPRRVLGALELGHR